MALIYTIICAPMHYKYNLCVYQLDCSVAGSYVFVTLRRYANRSTEVKDPQGKSY